MPEWSAPSKQPARRADPLARLPGRRLSNRGRLLARHYGPGDTVWPVSPILLQPVTLPARLPTLPTLDASDSRKWPRVINRLCSELGHPLRGPVQKPPCPYPGLRAFDATDVPRFYGRDADIGLLLGHLRHGRFVLVSGPSGAGKTSLVQAGLLPQLPASLHWPPGFWLTRTLRPGAHPLRALAAMLDATHGAATRRADRSAGGALYPAGRLLLVVDPLEEVFALAEPAEQEASSPPCRSCGPTPAVRWCWSSATISIPT